METVAERYSAVESALRERLGDGVLDAQVSRDQLMVRIPAERRPDALAAAKELGFRYYTFCAGVDWPEEERFEVLDNVYAIPEQQRITFRCDVPRDNPRVPTGSTVYCGAAWYERETYEMFGIVFAGHPQLARLFLPDWFEGFPLRKEYVLPARVEKPWPGEFFEG